MGISMPGVMSQHGSSWWWRLRIRSNVNRKESTGEAALASAWQVDMPFGAALEERATSAALALCD